MGLNVIKSQNTETITIPSADLIVNLDGLHIDASKWWRFMQVPELTQKQKMLYFEMIIDNALDELLENNPSMRHILAKDLT